MKTVGLLAACILLSAAISSCRQDFKDGKTYTGFVLNQFDDKSYIHDIKIKDGYTYLLDDKSDSALRIYRNDDLTHLLAYIPKGIGKDVLQKPVFCKEIPGHPYEGIRVMDDGLSLKTVNPEKGLAISSFSYIDGLSNSHDYNFIQEEVCAVPVFPYKDSPFYFYNEKKRYFRVEPDESLASVLRKIPVGYSASLCVNEKRNSIALAYRFTNHVSFYRLDGEPAKSFFIEKPPVMPVISGKEIDVEASTKCFTHIYGTAPYIYCLYDGSADFSNRSRLYIYTWEGKREATILLDRNIRTFAVDEGNNFILAVSRSPEDGQELVIYRIKTSSRP